MALTRIKTDGITDGSILNADINASAAIASSKISGLAGGATGVDFNDDVKARWGTGNDLEIYHNGSNSRIVNNHASQFSIASDVTAFTNAAVSENLAKFTANSNVQLYFDNVRKLETFSGGVQLDDDLVIKDGNKANFGDSYDLQIYHDGSNSWLTNATGSLFIKSDTAIKFQDAGGNEDFLVLNDNGAVELYYDNVKQVSTQSNGLDFVNNAYFPDNKGVNMGAGTDFTMYHDGTNSLIYNATGHLKVRSDNIIFKDKNDGDTYLNLNHDGAVELYYDGSKKLETNTDGVVVNGVTVSTGNIQINNDTGKVRLGASQDLNIYHNGTHSYLTNLTNNLLIESNTAVLRSVTQENYLVGTLNGAVSLYYDDSKKFETTSTGATLTGTFDADRVDCNGLFHIQYATSTNTNYMSTFNNNNGNMILFRGDGIFVGDNMNASNQAGGPNNKKIHLNTNGTVKVEDSAKFIAGTGEDLQIYHDGSNSFIANTGGELFISASQVNIKSAAGEYMAYFNDNAEAALYYDDSVKWKTTAEGVESPAGGRIQLRGGTTNGAEDCVLFVDKQNNNDWCIKALPHTGSSTDYGVMVKIHSNSSYAFAVQDEAPNWKFRVGGDGNCFNYNNSYGSISDVKLKENIVDANSQWNDIKALKIRNFNFKRDPSKKLLGVVAQEVETIAPGLVEEAPDVEGTVDLGTTTKHVKYSILYMKAIKALQEAMAKIEVLETKVAALGG